MSNIHNYHFGIYANIDKLKYITYVTIELLQNKLNIYNFKNKSINDIYKKDLTSLPSEIGILTNLKRLSLYNSKLTSLPSEIGNLSNLQRLYVFNNKLSELPIEIGRFNNLQSLNLSDSQLSELPKQIGS